MTSYPDNHNVSRLAHASCNQRSSSCPLVLRRPGEYTMRPHKTVMNQRPGFNGSKITTLGLNQLIDRKNSHWTTHTHTQLNSPTSKQTWFNGTLARRRSSHTYLTENSGASHLQYTQILAHSNWSYRTMYFYYILILKKTSKFLILKFSTQTYTTKTSTDYILIQAYSLRHNREDKIIPTSVSYWLYWRS